MIIDDDDKSLIDSKEKMTKIRSDLSSMFATKDSNFAFKCNHCKINNAFQHDSSIQINTTLLPSGGSVGKDTANSFSGTNVASVANEHTSADIHTKTTAENPKQVGSTPSPTINSSGLNAKAHSSDVNAEMKDLFKQLTKRTINKHQDTTNQDGSKLSMPAGSLPTVSSAISTQKPDETFSIHLSKFDVDTKFNDIAKYITGMTSLKLDTDFTVLKLLPKRKGFRRFLSFVSFKVVAANKDIFDKIMAPELWNPHIVASKFDSSISRLKRSQRKLDAPQGKAERKSHPNMKKQPPSDGNFSHHELNINAKGAVNRNKNLNLQNKQQQKPQQQQQHQQPKRQQKPQQQQQQPQSRQKKQQQQQQQQQQQPQKRNNGQHNHRRGYQQNSGKFKNPNFNGLPHPGNFDPYRGSNFHPTWWNGQAPANNTFNRRDQLFNILQQFFAQQPQY